MRHHRCTLVGYCASPGRCLCSRDGGDDDVGDGVDDSDVDVEMSHRQLMPGSSRRLLDYDDSGDVDGCLLSATTTTMR